MKDSIIISYNEIGNNLETKIDFLEENLNYPLSVYFATKNILVEISLYDFYESKTSFIDIETITSTHGFSLFTFTEISYNPMNGRIDWVNALYTRQ